MVSIDFVNDSQQMKLYDYAEKQTLKLWTDHFKSDSYKQESDINP